MATHSSILAWEIPWPEEPGGLQSTGSHRVRRDWAATQQQQLECSAVLVLGVWQSGSPVTHTHTPSLFRFFSHVAPEADAGTAELAPWLCSIRWKD